MNTLFTMIAAVLVMLMLSGCSHVQTLKRSCYQSSHPLEAEVGYCHAVRVGDTLHISGSIGRGDMGAAVEQAYASLRQTLALHGLTMDNIVSEHVQVNDIQQFLKNKNIRRSFYGEVLPASSWVQVDGFYSDDITVQIDVKAIYPRKFTIVNFDSW